MQITDTLLLHANEQPDKTAIYFETKKITYQTLYGKACKIGTKLSSIRANITNYRIAILLPNSIEFIETFLGAAMAGWTAVPLDTKWKVKDIVSNIIQYKINFIVTNQYFYKSMHNELTSTTFILIDEKLHDASSYEDFFMKNDYITNISTFTGEAPFYMGFTSGSTGVPKAFIRSHESWVESFKASGQEFGINQSDHVLSPGQLVHSHFLYAAIHTLYVGGTIHLLNDYSNWKLLNTLHNQLISVLYVVPTMLEALAGGKIGSEHQPQKIISSGAKWKPALKMKIMNSIVNSKLYEFYGASELSFVSVLDPEGNSLQPESVGKPFSGVEIEIRNMEGVPVGPEQSGKIFVKSKMTFLGYVDNPVETERVLVEDGWATVGDMGWIDNDGYLHIAGREKNMMIYGGLNIYPEEIEEVIGRHASVKEVVVTSIDNEKWGDIIVAVIQTIDSWKDLSEVELNRFCRKQLPASKCPKRYIFVEEFPLTSSGKVARKELKNRVIKHWGDLYE